MATPDPVRIPNALSVSVELKRTHETQVDLFESQLGLDSLPKPTEYPSGTALTGDYHLRIDPACVSIDVPRKIVELYFEVSDGTDPVYGVYPRFYCPCEVLIKWIE